MTNGTILDRFLHDGQDTLQKLYREVVVDLLETHGLPVPIGPLRIVDSGDLNAYVNTAGGNVQITIGAKLLFLLHVFNQRLLPLGVDAALGTDLDVRKSQFLVDHALHLVFAMSPPGPPGSVYEQIIHGGDGFEEFQHAYREYRSTRRNRMDHGAVEGMGTSIKAIVDRLSHPAQQVLLFEWQFKFLVLHEFAHVLLGHTDAPPSRDHELAADNKATELLLRQIQKYHPGPLDITPVSIIALLLVVKFVEDLIDVTNHATHFAISDGFKAGFLEIRHDYPAANARAALLMESFPREFTPLVISIATIMEYGLLALKRDFQFGLIDLRYFKWYCRVRALEMTATFATRMMEPEVRKAFIDMLDIQMGWDTADLRRGPLVPEIFGPGWFSTIFLGDAAR
jgi:hypothetical protein